MWMDQRERNSKSVWIWGSILFHAGVAAYFVFSSSPPQSPISSSANASETVTMTLAENKAPEAKISEEIKEAAPAAKQEKVVVAQPKAKPAKSIKKKATPVVKALPKKEIKEVDLTEQEDQPKEENTVSGVVIPETAEEPAKVTELKDLKEQSLDEQVANMPEEEIQEKPEPVKQQKPVKEEPFVAIAPPTEEPEQSGEGKESQNENHNVGEKSSAQPASANNVGTASNPRSYLELKQKPGNTPPRYPELARRQGTQGDVHLKYLVKEDGSISNIQVLKSSGSPLLDKEAVSSISQYQYYPGQQGWATHPVSFSLKGPQQVAPARLRTSRGS